MIVKKKIAPSLERQLISLLELKKKGSLPPELYKGLRSSGGLTLCLYGLPKIHKPGVPLRSIVSFVNLSALKPPSQDSLPIDRKFRVKCPELMQPSLPPSSGQSLLRRVKPLFPLMSYHLSQTYHCSW